MEKMFMGILRDLKIKKDKGNRDLFQTHYDNRLGIKRSRCKFDVLEKTYHVVVQRLR